MMENLAFQTLMAKMAAAAIAEAAKANNPSSASPSASAGSIDEPALRPFVPLCVDKPFNGRSGPDAAASYIALCGNNLEENARFFRGDDADADKVWDAARGLLDVALVWYNNLRNQKSSKLLSWSVPQSLRGHVCQRPGSCQPVRNPFPAAGQDVGDRAVRGFQRAYRPPPGGR